MAKRRADRSGAGTTSTTSTPVIRTTVGAASDLFASQPEQPPNTGPTGPTGPTLSATSSAFDAASSLTYQQIQQVRGMIDDHAEKVDTKLKHAEDRIEARLAQLPSETYLRGLAKEARYWIIGTAIAILGALFLFISYGRDQFEAGITLTTGTINYGIAAKEANEKAKEAQDKFAQQMKEIKEVLEQLKRPEPPKPKQAP